ncbi:MAG: type III-A CRISPR-associated RAMP protein Csm3, partial [Bacteroidia bacterium]|nr:type III-A CRISPR-associated RAMP protein Csm3 [Bacteroidia bacterium]
MERKYQLVKKILIKGEIETLTGLKIGGSQTAMSIGGIDNSVIRNPLDNKPYIPGSSIKGKMRSLLELRDGTIGNKKMGVIDHGPTEDPNSRVGKLFGCLGDKKVQRASKIMVRDCTLLTPEEKFSKTDLPYTEAKTEVVLDRVTAKAMPRSIERVPAGVQFGLEIILTITSEDNEKEFLTDTFHALRLLQDDSLGGYGSRGYGQVKIRIKQLIERTAAFYRGEDVEKDR